MASRFVLPNGFSLWSLPWESGTVALSLRCRVGSDGDPAGRAGLTSLTTRMLTEGTKEATALEQAVAFEDLGAALDWDTGSDTMALSTEVLPHDTAHGVALLAEALREPGFRESDFERVKSERLDELEARARDPERLAWLLTARAVLGPRLGRSTSGSPKDIGNTELSDVVRLHRESLGPERCALLAAGSVAAVELEASALEAFLDWNRGTRPVEAAAPVPEPSFEGADVLFLERADAVQSVIIVGRALPGRRAPGHEAREVINGLFGELFTSRLNTNLRERNGFTYGAFSALVATRDYGAWMLSSSVRADATARALAEMRSEIARLLSEPPVADEVQRARAHLIQRRRSFLEHDTRLLQNIAEMFTFGLPLDHFAGYAQRLEALDQGTLNATARFLSSGEFVAIVVGPPAVAPTLAGRVRAAERSWLE